MIMKCVFFIYHIFHMKMALDGPLITSIKFNLFLFINMKIFLGLNITMHAIPKVTTFLD
jgi:hypothetical protein